MALMALAADWAQAAGRGLIILTVDHGVRTASADEAAFVSGEAQALGLEVETLRWAQPRPGQARARTARHRLLAGAARAAGANCLLTGHTADDQAETFLIRAAAGSGPRGLAGVSPMAPSPVWPEGRGQIVVRPLIGVSRAALRRVLAARDLPWIEDPSNSDPAYERVRWRRRLAASPALAARALDVQARFAALRRAADAVIADWLCNRATAHADGTIEVGVGPLPRGLLAPALDLLLQAAAGRGRPSDRAGLAALAADVAGGGPETGRTFAGAYVSRRRGRLRLARDPGGVEGEATGEATGDVWDGRFERFAGAASIQPSGGHASVALPRGAEAGGWRALAPDRLALWARIARPL